MHRYLFAIAAGAMACGRYSAGQATVTIAGDEATIDFAGSSPQSRHGINVVLNYTHAYASFAMKAALAPAQAHLGMKM